MIEYHRQEDERDSETRQGLYRYGMTPAAREGSSANLFELV